MSESLPQQSTKPAKPILSDSVYNKLKTSAVIVLPAIGALYLALAQLWDLPNAEAVVGTTTALNVFIGALVGVSSRSYSKITPTYVGDLVAEPHPDGSEKMVLVAHLNDDPDAISKMDQVIFRVK